MKERLHWLNHNLKEFILVVLLIAMTVIMGVQVFSRYALRTSLSWTEELTRYLFIGNLAYLCRKKFAEEVFRLSDGSMKIQVYANSTLGDRELLESCSDGDIPFVLQNPAPQVTFMPDLAVFDLPCVFDSLDDCREKLDDPTFYDLIGGVYTQAGYHLLGMADQSFRVMSTNRAVTSFQDFRGQKIRTMEIWKALGASPAPMSFSEVYVGLQQHTIDAQENPYEVKINCLYHCTALGGCLKTRDSPLEYNVSKHTGR